MKKQDRGPAAPGKRSSETDALAGALDKLLYWARLQRDYPPCKHCDPGGEGNEIWGELTVTIEDALRDAGRPIHARSPLGGARISRPRSERRTTAGSAAPPPAPAASEKEGTP